MPRPVPCRVLEAKECDSKETSSAVRDVLKTGPPVQMDVGRGCAADGSEVKGKNGERAFVTALRGCECFFCSADPLRLAAEKKKAFFASTLDPRSLGLLAQAAPTGRARDYSMTDRKI